MSCPHVGLRVVAFLIDKGIVHDLEFIDINE